MYDNYFLSSKNKEIINNFKINEILLISGRSGIGKSSLAKEILKDYSITLIDTMFLKKNIDFEDYIENIIKKKDIMSLMYNKQTQRSILIDDIDVIKKYDKKIYNSILTFLENKKFYDTKIIIICKDEFINNRSLNKINYKSINLSYTQDEIIKISNNICENKCIILKHNTRKNILNKSNYNLNVFIQLLNDFNNVQSEIDLNYTTNDLYLDLFTKRMPMKEFINKYVNDRITLTLNILDSIVLFVKDLKRIIQIYDNIILGDYCESLFIDNISEYSCIYTIYNIYQYIYDTKYKQIKNNNYISHSLIIVSNNKLFQNKLNDELIYIYLYYYNVNCKLEKFMKSYLSKLNKKCLNFYIKSFNTFYNAKINIKKIKLN